MIKTKEKLVEEIEKIIDPKNWDKGVSGLEVEIILTEENNWKSPEKKKCIKVSMKKMYDYYSFTFEHFDKFSALFQTEDINLRNGDNYSGCETCDYGSSYETILEVFNSPLQQMFENSESSS